MKFYLKLQRHRFALAMVAILLLALVLRFSRLPLRWNQITLAYAAYQEPFVSRVEDGQWIQAVGTFFGLHPPFYSLLFWAWSLVWGTPGSFHVLSALFSVAAVVVVGRGGLILGGPRVGGVGALLLATSLYHLHYSLEVNNYPLLVLMSALSHLTFMPVVTGKTRVWPWVGCAALGVWTHMLGGVLLGVQGLILLMRRRPAPLGWALLLCLPLAPAVVERLALGSTYHNEVEGAGLLWQQAVVDMVQQFGPPILLGFGLILVVLGLARGLMQAHRVEVLSLGVCLAGGVLVNGLMIGLGVAAPHQHPYWLYLLPPWVILVGLGLCPPRPQKPVGWTLGWGTLLVLGILVVPNLASAARQVVDALLLERAFQGQPHLIRSALHGMADTPRSALWLVAPPLYPDDNKLAQDVVYTEISPWWRCEFYTPPTLHFEFIDYAYGQPYRCQVTLSPLSGPPQRREMYLYTFADVYGESQRRLGHFHLHQGIPIEVVLYDVGGSPDYLPRMRSLLMGVAASAGASLWERSEGTTVWWHLTPPEGGI